MSFLGPWRDSSVGYEYLMHRVCPQGSAQIVTVCRMLSWPGSLGLQLDGLLSVPALYTFAAASKTPC